MSKAAKRKSSSESKRRSSSIGERKPSVFDRLGTKALPSDPQPSLCPHNIYHAYCTVCPTQNPASTQLPVTSSGGSVKRSAKKEADLRPSVERASPDTDWADWDQSELEYQDEKALERRRQQLRRELELQMSSDRSRDISPKNNNLKKRSSSSCSTSSSSSLSSSSSSNSSTQKLDSKKIAPSSPDRVASTNKKLSKMVYKETSPGRKLSKKSPGNKMYKKSMSPSQAGAASSRKSPSNRLNSRKKGLDRDRSRQRSASRERRRERSKEVRHRSRLPHMSQHSTHRSSERRKDEQRLRRDQVRRDRRSDTRDSRRDKGEEMRLRERCRDRESSRREKCSRASHQPRAKEQATAATAYTSSSRRSTPLSPPAYHHHYRGERGRYGSSERDRVSGYKELSPKEQESRLRLTRAPSTSYAQDSNRMRRRGGGGGGWGDATRYDSPKCPRDWGDSANERIHEWQRGGGGGKHNQDKEFSSVDKQKDIEWKRSAATSGRDLDDGSQVKRARLDDPPPPPPPPIINEPDLSDISDDPDDILNRDDGEEVDEDCLKRCQVAEEAEESVKEDEGPAPLSLSLTASGLEQRLMHQRIADDEPMDSLDFEEISDEELEDESKNNKVGCDAAGVDWASFIAECRVDKSWNRCDSSTGKPWHTDRLLRRIGVSRKYAGDTLFQSVQKQLTADGGEGLLSDVGGIQSALMQRRQRLATAQWSDAALSLHSRMPFRRQKCGLAVVAVQHCGVGQDQVA